MLNQTGFDLWTDGYDRTVGLSDEADEYPFAGYRDVLGRIYSLAMQKQDAAVLDLGFGTAVLTSRLYEGGCRIYGQDFSPRMIELARPKMPGATLIAADLADGLHPDLACRRYDVVIATYSLHHLPFADQCALLRQLMTLLNPGGFICIGDVAFPTRADMEACARRCGNGWDSDEIYFVQEELAREFPGQISFEPMSHCAGLFILRP